MKSIVFRNGIELPQRVNARVTEKFINTPYNPRVTIEPHPLDNLEYDAILGDDKMLFCLFGNHILNVIKDYSSFVKLYDYIKYQHSQTLKQFGQFEGFYYCSDYYSKRKQIMILRIEGYLVKMFYEHDKNFYHYAQVIQPDGNVWYGFNVYGDEPFDKEDKINFLKQIFWIT